MDVKELKLQYWWSSPDFCLPLLIFHCDNSTVFQHDIWLPSVRKLSYIRLDFALEFLGFSVFHLEDLYSKATKEVLESIPLALTGHKKEILFLQLLFKWRTSIIVVNGVPRLFKCLILGTHRHSHVLISPPSSYRNSILHSFSHLPREKIRSNEETEDVTLLYARKTLWGSFAEDAH